MAVDYLTKWVETAALPDGTAGQAARFFVEHIVFRHGAPKALVSDNGRNFVAEMMENVLRLMETNHKTNSKYHPQANVLVSVRCIPFLI